ncbi:hypothetical protein FB381_2016 [Nocardioides albertanoniae]|uniref:Uncharacterized protein n=2 Tax=Nocardioides albertanoniae TaxID=1175486 RepID=A0A543A6D9_9ACTN|nr:hypothetical protein FB381_2016 [Nocardioides albertanoniae]
MLRRKQIALAGMAAGMAMTSVGIGGLVVGNAGAEEPPPSYATDEGASELISPVSPVAPLEKSEKSSQTPQTQPYNRAPGTEAPDTMPASPRAIEESITGSTSPYPERPSRIPTEQRPTSKPPSSSPGDPSGSPTESPSDPSESPTESPSDPSESPSEPSESPSDPSESPSDPSESPDDPSGSPSEPTE